MEKTIRLLRLSKILLRKGRRTLPQIAETLEVSIRTAYRDLLDLEETGWKIWSDRGRLSIDPKCKCPMCGKPVDPKKAKRKRR